MPKAPEQVLIHGGRRYYLRGQFDKKPRALRFAKEARSRGSYKVRTRSVKAWNPRASGYGKKDIHLVYTSPVKH